MIESLRIATQDWSNEEVDFYMTSTTRTGVTSLALCRGNPIYVERLPESRFVVHTDKDHRFKWRATDVSSGLSIPKRGDDRKFAIAELERAIDRYGVARFRAMLASSRDGLASVFSALRKD